MEMEDAGTDDHNGVSLPVSNYFKALVKELRDEPENFHKFVLLLQDYKNKSIDHNGIIRGLKELLKHKLHLFHGFKELLNEDCCVEGEQTKAELAFLHVCKVKDHFGNDQRFQTFTEIFTKFTAKEKTKVEVYQEMQNLIGSHNVLFEEFRKLYGAAPETMPSPTEPSGGTPKNQDGREDCNKGEQEGNESNTGHEKANLVERKSPSKRKRIQTSDIIMANHQQEGGSVEPDGRMGYVNNEMERADKAKHCRGDREAERGKAPVADDEIVPEDDGPPAADDEIVLKVDKAPVADDEVVPEVDKAPVADDEIVPEVDKAPVADDEIVPEVDKAPVADDKIVPEVDKPPVADDEIVPEVDKAPVADDEIVPEVDKAPVADDEIIPEPPASKGDDSVAAKGSCRGSVRLVNQYERELFKLEDDRYHFNLLQNVMASTTKRAEKLLEKISNEQAKGGMRRRMLRLEEHFTALTLWCIGEMYGDHRFEVIETLRKDPAKALPVIIARLKKKERELSIWGSHCNEIWKVCVARNYRLSRRLQGTIQYIKT